MIQEMEEKSIIMILLHSIMQLADTQYIRPYDFDRNNSEKMIDKLVSDKNYMKILYIMPLL